MKIVTLIADGGGELKTVIEPVSTKEKYPGGLYLFLFPKLTTQSVARLCSGLLDKWWLVSRWLAAISLEGAVSTAY